MSDLVTIILSIAYEDRPVSKGDKFLLRKSTTATTIHKMRLYQEDGNLVGFLAEKNTCISGSLTDSEIEAKFIDVMTVEVVGERVVAGDKAKYLGKILIEEKGENLAMSTEYRFKLSGGKTLYPNKYKLSDELKKGLSPTIKLVKEGDKIVAYFQDVLCGVVDNRKQNGIYTSDEMKDLLIGEKVAKIVEQVTTNFIGVVQMSDEESRPLTATQTINEEMERILVEGIMTKKDLQERVNYMKQNGVTEKQMSKMFSSYKLYAEDIQARIKKPKTLYVDSDGFIKKSVAYMNLKKNLLFEGDRGVGKNILTETLAWLYHRPLYEFSLNSQHDNNSLLGGKTFETEVTVEGKEKMTMGFEPEVIVQAGEVGGVLVFDEFNTSFGHVMSLFNSMLDDRRRLVVPGYKTIDLDDNFMAIATQNKDYSGTFENNEATIDRFVPILFPALRSIEGILIAKVPGISAEVVEKCQKLFEGMKHCISNNEIEAKTMSIRGFIVACEAVEQDIPLKEGLIDNVANRATDIDERRAIKRMIENILG